MHGDNLQRVSIKIFAENGAIGDLHRFVPIFHSWIQRKVLPGHLLIDVHDYSHIHNGPGILLVAHEANLSVDCAQGRPGLLYQRKQPLEGALQDRIRTCLSHLLQACGVLEQEPELAGKLWFSRDELLLIANDRLLAPNDAQTYARLRAAAAAACAPLLGKVSLTHTDLSPKERLTVSIRGGQSH